MHSKRLLSQITKRDKFQIEVTELSENINDDFKIVIYTNMIQSYLKVYHKKYGPEIIRKVRTYAIISGRLYFRGLCS